MGVGEWNNMKLYSNHSIIRAVMIIKHDKWASSYNTGRRNSFKMREKCGWATISVTYMNVTLFQKESFTRIKEKAINLVPKLFIDERKFGYGKVRSKQMVSTKSNKGKSRSKHTYKMKRSCYITEKYEEFETSVRIRHPSCPQVVQQDMCRCWFCDLELMVYG